MQKNSPLTVHEMLRMALDKEAAWAKEQYLKAYDSAIKKSVEFDRRFLSSLKISAD